MTPASFRDATIAALEHKVAANFDLSAEVYTGERLLELLLMNDRAGDIPGPPEYYNYARRWATKDPQGMYEWLRRKSSSSFPSTDVWIGLMKRMLPIWATQDAGAAVAAALGCPRGQDRADALAAILDVLWKTDPARAAEIAAEHVAVLASDRTGNLSASGKDFAEKWSFLCKLPVGKNRAAILTRYFDSVTRNPGGDAERLWREAPVEIRFELVAGGFNPTEAGFIRSLSGSGGKAPVFDGFSDLMRQRAETSGDQLTAARYITAFGKELAEHDPAAAVAWARTYLRGEGQVRHTAQLFTYAATHDFDAALRTWQTLPDGIIRARAAGRIASAAPGSWEAEINSLLATLPPGDQAIAQAERKQADRQRMAGLLLVPGSR